MQLFVDDQKIDDEFIHEGTLKDAIQHVQSQVCAPGQLVVALRCDGEQVAAEAMTETLERPAPSFDRLEVFTSTREDLVIETMNQASASLEQTEEAYDRVAQLLIQGETGEAVKGLGQCLQVWQQVHDAVGKSIDMLGIDPDQVQVRDDTLMEAITKPKDVLIQIRDALQKQDFVLLADVLQYEFAEVTQTWHSIVTRLHRAAEEAREATQPSKADHINR